MAVWNENGFAQQLNGKLYRIFIALLFAVVVLNGFRPMLDNVDLGWHIAQGRWMVHHLAIYRADAFNYPNLGHEVIDEYPIFQIVLYVFSCLGWWGPCLLTALCYAFLFGILIGAARSLGLVASTGFALSLGLSLLYLQIAFPLRPHLATYMGIAIFGTFLLRHREAGAWTHFWPLALMQVIWTNCHSGFVIGPAMVALFGLEMVVRRWRRGSLFPWTAVRTWAGAGALVFLGCFVNPYGVLRFYPPFYQEQLESIRAYVGEMQPLNPGAGAVYNQLTLYAILLVAFIVLLRRGAVSVSFVFLALFFYIEALTVKKSWPVFGIFLPLLILSTAAFARITITRRKWTAWFRVAGQVVVIVPIGMALATRLDGHSDGALTVLWQQFDEGRTELPVEAVAWMKEHHVTGRIFHRCEDGGWLQQEGFTETFTDTGFGKYDEALIRETGLVANRPALLAGYFAAYRPDFIVCDGFALRWPAYLIKDGLRMVFYSPNSSVWTWPSTRPDLPTVQPAQAQAAFDSDMDRYGRPRDLVLYGRDLIALHSMGFSDFVFARLMGLPAELHRQGWYWEAARIICFDDPVATESNRAKLHAEAAKWGDDRLTVEFRAYDAYAEHRVDEAERILATIPLAQLSDPEATLLLRIKMEKHDPGALALARNSSLFDLSNGERWMDLAALEGAEGSRAAANAAWRKAIFYWPDDPAVQMGAHLADDRFVELINEAVQPYGTK